MVFLVKFTVNTEHILKGNFVKKLVPTDETLQGPNLATGPARPRIIARQTYAEFLLI
jgi:hypothetical protein